MSNYKPSLRAFAFALFAALILAWPRYGDWAYLWQAQWHVLHIALTAFTCYGLGRATHWSVGLFAGVALLSGLLAGQMPLTTLPNLSVIGVVLLLLFFSMVGSVSLIYELGFAVCGVCAAYTVLWREPAGLIGNASLNGCLMAMTLPLAIKRQAARRPLPDRLEVVVGLTLTWLAIAIFYSREATPVMMLVGYTGACLIAWGHWKYLYAAALPLAIGFIYQGHALIEPRGRFEEWRSVFNWWKQSGAYVLGNGSGSGQVLFPFLGQNKPSPHPFYWAHNEYLGILFENGVLGVLSFALMAFFVLRRAYGRPWLFGALASVLVMMAFNSPMHHALHAFFAASLVWLTFQQTEW